MRVSTKARDDALVTYSSLSPMEDKNKTHDKNVRDYNCRPFGTEFIKSFRGSAAMKSPTSFDT